MQPLLLIGMEVASKSASCVRFVSAACLYLNIERIHLKKMDDYLFSFKGCLYLSALPLEMEYDSAKSL